VGKCGERLSISDVAGLFELSTARSVGNNAPFPTRSADTARPSRETVGAVDYEQVFLSHLPVIERIVAGVCRRHHLRETEAQDFASEVKLHLVDRDYDVLRRFQRRSSLHTYLTVVVQRLFLNYRNRIWGRWRPSAEASRLGPVAVLLERLVTRDGWNFEEAQEHLRINHGVDQSRDELYELWTRLPGTSKRRFVSDDSAKDIPSREPGPDTHIVRAERDLVDRRLRLALDRARETLTADDRLLLKMRFDDGFTVSEIAAVLHLRQKPLYRTFDRLFARLREHLVANGVSADDIRVEDLGV
jgi:RNA polymerase sigma factor (sigma-70 family)